MDEYKTTAEFGPFCECSTIVDYVYIPPPREDDSGTVNVYGGRFYYNGQWIEYDEEAALNLRPYGSTFICDEILEWHEERIEEWEDGRRCDDEYEREVENGRL